MITLSLFVSWHLPKVDAMRAGPPLDLLLIPAMDLKRNLDMFDYSAMQFLNGAEQSRARGDQSPLLLLGPKTVIKKVAGFSRRDFVCGRGQGGGRARARPRSPSPREAPRRDTTRMCRPAFDSAPIGRQLAGLGIGSPFALAGSATARGLFTPPWPAASPVPM